jgi:hypothetical protein
MYVCECLIFIVAVKTQGQLVKSGNDAEENHDKYC